jgi:site-specific DNA recombinase
MNQFQLIQSFPKGKASDNTKQSQRNAVIYTRVSTKEQADTNQSLEIQKKYCLQYALKNDLNVLGFFGGTYESAKTDERNEFNLMIRFVKNQKEGVSAILVYSLDRFSRTGDKCHFYFIGT